MNLSEKKLSREFPIALSYEFMTTCFKVENIRRNNTANNINNSLWWQSKNKKANNNQTTENSAMILSLLINYPNTYK